MLERQMIGASLEKLMARLVEELVHKSFMLGVVFERSGKTSDDYRKLYEQREDKWAQFHRALNDGGWIPLAEGLPEPNETVEIWLPNNSYVKIAPAHFHILGTGVKVFSGVTTYSLKEVSHWREIVGPREEN